MVAKAEQTGEIYRDGIHRAFKLPVDTLPSIHRAIIWRNHDCDGLWGAHRLCALYTRRGTYQPMYLDPELYIVT